MRIMLGEELWIVHEDNGPVLIRPTAVFSRDGRGAPGVISPRPTVLRPGQIVELRILDPTSGD